MAVNQELVTQICGQVRKDVLQGINQSMLAAFVWCYLQSVGTLSTLLPSERYSRQTLCTYLGLRMHTLCFLRSSWLITKCYLLLANHTLLCMLGPQQEGGDVWEGGWKDETIFPCTTDVTKADQCVLVFSQRALWFFCCIYPPFSPVLIFSSTIQAMLNLGGSFISTKNISLGSIGLQHLRS